ncbi:hypothetical protein HG535_0H02310 [Zygotorulaspora mrakii]|uniref:Uncharacterized protein n=1 Tax=Zygotorulaspora mrakii TaxID=42260 RepID=A0A7H9B9D7_ZYGMR|nr:uncharacterized protein HG535_0H02310 [Zygotorulaspora mrakii]QLG74904.1 hypothetical protein HG535_0H02310 [Zygotorulaspora mrakii]
MRKNIGGNNKSDNRGLKTAINPLLLSSNLNLVSKQYKGQNPYLSTSQQRTPDSKIRKRYELGLRFYEKGEISSQVEQLRDEQRKELERERQRTTIEQQKTERENKELSIKIAKGELPDLSLGEDKYIKTRKEVPKVEWWDEAYLDDDMKIKEKYVNQEIEDNESDDDEKYGPSIQYVHHPVPIKVDTNKEIIAKVLLTKDEQKKIRRNKRKMLREEKETRIKLGLDPKPEPKVKLSNMMSVYENDANIVDPTKWEQAVKEQVALRKRKHLEENSKRHDEAKQKAKSEDSQNGGSDDICQVFWFKRLTNPKLRYKINMNSKQLSLRGTCLRIGEQGPGIMVIVGREKSCKFFKKLVTRRVTWDDAYEDKTTNTIVDMTGNYCKQIWEGYLDNCRFPRWFMKVCEDETDFSNTLAQFNAQNLVSIFKQSNN